MNYEFGIVLDKAVERIKKLTGKNKGDIQTELGEALGRKGGYCIVYWSQGHMPAKFPDIKKLTQELIRRNGFEDKQALKQFLHSAEEEALYEKLEPEFDRFSGMDQTTEDFSPEDIAPFVVGKPIIHPRQFFGRERELKRIFGLWKTFPLQNIAVIGLKRSGKSSLLYYLKNITITPSAQLRPDQRTDWLPDHKSYRWVLVDFQDPRMTKLEKLLSYLLNELDIPLPTPCDLDNFIEVVERHLRTPTIIMMDELGVGLASPELIQEFWWGLRSLCSTKTGGQLGFVLTSYEIPALVAYKHGKPSPFFNIFSTTKLGPLTEEEAHKLILNSPRPFTPADVAWMMEQSRCWPALLQILCQARLYALENDEPGERWKTEGLEQIQRHRYLLDVQP